MSLYHGPLPPCPDTDEGEGEPLEDYHKERVFWDRMRGGSRVEGEEGKVKVKEKVGCEG